MASSSGASLIPVPKLPTIPALADTIRQGFAKLLGGLGSFPSDPYIRTGARYLFTVIRQDGTPALGWNLQVKAILGYSIDPTTGIQIENVVWTDFFQTDAKGQAGGTIPFAVRLTGLYRFTLVANDSAQVYRGSITWNEAGFTAYNSGVQARIDLSTGTNTATTGGATQDQGTGSGQAKYHSVTFTLKIGGKGEVGTPVAGYLAGPSQSGSGRYIRLAGSAFGSAPTGTEAKTDANGKVVVEFNTALDPTIAYRYSIWIGARPWNSGTAFEFYFEYKPGVFGASAGPSAVELAIEYDFSGVTGDTARMVSSPPGTLNYGPAIVQGHP